MTQTIRCFFFTAQLSTLVICRFLIELVKSFSMQIIMCGYRMGVLLFSSNAEGWNMRTNNKWIWSIFKPNAWFHLGFWQLHLSANSIFWYIMHILLPTSLWLVIWSWCPKNLDFTWAKKLPVINKLLHHFTGIPSAMVAQILSHQPSEITISKGARYHKFQTVWTSDQTWRMSSRGDMRYNIYIYK